MDTKDAQLPPVADIVERKRARALDAVGLRTLFHEAYSANGFLPEPVPHEVLERAVELAELGPTSSNTVPMRILFVESEEAKGRLLPALSKGNVAKVLSAPVTAIVCADLQFHEFLGHLVPHRPEMRERFADPSGAEKIREMAFMNATLQGAYFLLAARAVGLDCGPMGGFDRTKTDEAFFPNGRWKSIFLIALGYADDEKARPRAPRLAVDDITRFE
jgi:3-hydroxypropanoate dehydrogenase